MLIHVVCPVVTRCTPSCVGCFVSFRAPREWQNAFFCRGSFRNLLGVFDHVNRVAPPCGASRDSRRLLAFHRNWTRRVSSRSFCGNSVRRCKDPPKSPAPIRLTTYNYSSGFCGVHCRLYDLSRWGAGNATLARCLRCLKDPCCGSRTEERCQAFPPCTLCFLGLSISMRLKALL